ncbi:hypothetical protein [Roseovarius aestuariivivens]|uniref:hypothetical protein n=1 Tax=Roseovarius aestuariivivens TaxID=1888910 RepID=UPI001080134A|nr:hypothetical protein [Roseovarius aestuariivivens]
MMTTHCHQFVISVYTALAVLSASAAWSQEVWMFVTHEVEDFDRWQVLFDHALPTRRAMGEIAAHILHNPNDENVVTVWFEWDTMQRARAWATDPALANGMAAAGVISTPVFSFYDIKAALGNIPVVLGHR